MMRVKIMNGTDIQDYTAADFRGIAVYHSALQRLPLPLEAQNKNDELFVTLHFEHKMDKIYLDSKVKKEIIIPRVPEEDAEYRDMLCEC